ncbi:MAG: OB-fold nucleic acid binding domain-containing protein, partial [Planctomycetota bacterium]
ENIVKNGRMAGQRMARFQLEDLEGNVNVTVFPRTLEAVKERLEDDVIVVVQATAEDRGEGMALVLEELLTVEDAIGRFEGALVIKLDPADEQRLPDLKSLLTERSGGNALYFDVEGGDGRTRRVRAPRNNVALDPDLIRELDTLLEPGRCSLARI